MFEEHGKIVSLKIVFLNVMAFVVDAKLKLGQTQPPPFRTQAVLFSDWLPWKLFIFVVIYVKQSIIIYYF